MSVTMESGNETRHVERRASKRHSVRLPVIVRVDGAETVHMTVNASAGGLLIRPPIEEIAVDGQVEIDVGALALDVEAVVIAHRNQGSALRFVDTSIGEQIALGVAEQAQRSG